jgi:amidase
VEPADIPNLEAIGDPEWLVLLYEFKAGMAAYLDERGATADFRTLAELIRFNETNREQELPYFGQEIFERAEEKGSLESAEYQEALERCRRLSRSEGIDKVMDDLNLDALVAASGPPAWLIDLVNGDCSKGGASGAPAVSGYPHITLPAGDVFGLPIGLSIFGRGWSEGTLLRIAYAYEQATHHRRPPTFAATVDLRA